MGQAEKRKAKRIAKDVLAWIAQQKKRLAYMVGYKGEPWLRVGSYYFPDDTGRLELARRAAKKGLAFGLRYGTIDPQKISRMINGDRRG